MPPYMKPVEPNVPPQIVEGYTKLGNYIRDEMTRAWIWTNDGDKYLDLHGGYTVRATGHSRR